MRIKNPKIAELKFTTLKALNLFAQTKKFKSKKELIYTFFNQCKMNKVKIGFPLNSPDKLYLNILKYINENQFIISLKE